MSVTTAPWDVAEHLDSDEAAAAYLDAVFEDGDPALIKVAIGDVARSRGMEEVARKAGLSRAGLHEALTDTGNPSFATVAAVVRALGARLAAEAA